MELAAQAEMRGVRMEDEREQNPEADDLSNLKTSSFDPHKEAKINLKGQSWLVLPELLEAGQQFHEQKAWEAEEQKEEELGRGRGRRRTS